MSKIDSWLTSEIPEEYFSPLKESDPRPDRIERGSVLRDLEEFYGAIYDGEHTYYWKTKAAFFESRLEVRKHFVGKGIFAYHFSRGTVVVREQLECRRIKIRGHDEWESEWEVVAIE